ncbi:MAG: response regulator transcription factor [Gammaproteobacteria bacterium]|nr:response regulator transcription factor [Gammaproteobacteria bacterium]MBU1722597.1 response regulator transcription factor [Gammaproteobacteria bacterium]MBU2007069.1 response regulator transcription factor [Gammaproteobacteria bacterium]
MNKLTNCQGHILLVEDDELLSELLEKYLSSHNYTVTTLPNGEQLEASLRHQPIDAILLDIMLPGQNGLHWLEWLKDNHPNLPVLLCSRRADAEDRAIGLSQGAADYIVKPFHPKEVLCRLHNLLNLRNQQEKRHYRIGGRYFDAERSGLVGQREGRDATLIRLSQQEAVLLKYLYQNQRQIITRDHIAEVLYGFEHDPNRRNIDMLINRLRKKLGDSSETPRYLHTVWGRGYRFTPDA